MADRTCARCGAVFGAPWQLRRHFERKKPCVPTAVGGEHRGPVCPYCNRQFATPKTLSRHVRQNCKLAGPGAADGQSLRNELAAVKTQVTELSKLVRTQLGAPAVLQTSLTQVNAHVNVGQVHLNIKQFDVKDPIAVPVAMVKAAFTENPRLVEYCRMSDSDRVDADKAAPFVLEALLELVRRAHHDPVYRNVCLNPRRADQAMVYIGEDQRWETRGLADVVRALFDGVAGKLRRLITTDSEREQLPPEVQGAAAWVPGLYEDEPERFVRDGKGSIAAHLANTRYAYVS